MQSGTDQLPFADLIQELHWVQHRQRPTQLFRTPAGNMVVGQETFAGRCRRVVLLRHLRAFACFRYQLEGWLKEVHWRNLRLEEASAKRLRRIKI
jgi:hypothetical protein